MTAPKPPVPQATSQRGLQAEGRTGRRTRKPEALGAQEVAEESRVAVPSLGGRDVMVGEGSSGLP